MQAKMERVEAEREAEHQRLQAVEAQQEGLLRFVQQLGEQQGWQIPLHLLAPQPPPQSTPVSMFYFLCSCLVSNLEMAFVPDLLMCGPSCRVSWCVGLRAGNVVVGLRADVFLAGFGNVPVQGRCCRNFQLFFKLLTFLSCHSRAISSFLCSGHRRRRQTRSEGRRHRKSGHPHPDRRRDRTLGRSRREPLVE